MRVERTSAKIYVELTPKPSAAVLKATAKRSELPPETTRIGSLKQPNPVLRDFSENRLSRIYLYRLRHPDDHHKVLPDIVLRHLPAPSRLCPASGTRNQSIIRRALG
jgi:hypothetical protein